MTKSLPTLTDADRKRALELAMKARHERTRLKQYMKAGRVSLADALDDSCAQRLPVRQLLASIPGIGTAKAERIMSAYHIAQNRRVAGLGPRQREALLKLEESGWDPALYRE